MSKIYVKPAAGRLVLLPGNGKPPFPQVPDQGMWLEEDVFVTRRLMHGDLVKVDAPAGARASDQMPETIAAPRSVPSAAAEPATPPAVIATPASKGA
jgi:hypothetical protein